MTLKEKAKASRETKKNEPRTFEQSIVAAQRIAASRGIQVYLTAMGGISIHEWDAGASAPTQIQTAEKAVRLL